MERYLAVNLLGPGPRLMKKIIYRAAVSTKVEKHCSRLVYDVQGTSPPRRVTEPLIAPERYDRRGNWYCLKCVHTGCER